MGSSVRASSVRVSSVRAKTRMPLVSYHVYTMGLCCCTYVQLYSGMKNMGICATMCGMRAQQYQYRAYLSVRYQWTNVSVGLVMLL
jgi:hypothetical protein